MAIAACDLAGLADVAELPFLAGARLNRTERRGSKKSLSQKRRSGRIAILIVVSRGRPGNGDSVLIIAHSCREKPSLSASSVCEDWLQTTNPADPSNRPKPSAAFRIAHLHGRGPVIPRIRLGKNKPVRSSPQQLFAW